MNNTPTPMTDDGGRYCSHQRRKRWIKTVPLKTSEELERELAAVTEQLKETRKHLKEANRGAEINAHALRINVQGQGHLPAAQGVVNKEDVNGG